MPKFIVEYALDYVHTVRVGVDAESAQTAGEHARNAFDAGTLWDDTPAMPLLFDDFEEIDHGRVLSFEAEAVDVWPPPDGSARQARVQAAAHVAGKSRLHYTGIDLPSTVGHSLFITRYVMPFGG